MSAVLSTPFPIVAPSRGLLTGKSWSAVLAAIVVVAVLVPVLNLAVPVGSAFHLSEYAVHWWARSCATRSARSRWT